MKALIDSLVPRGGGKRLMEGVAVGLLSLSAEWRKGNSR